MKEQSAPLSLPGLNYSTSQQAWIAKTQLWCGMTWFSEDRQKYLIPKEDYDGTHSTAAFRVLGPFSNSEQFSKDWACPKNSPMNPSQKCTLYGKSPWYKDTHILWAKHVNIISSIKFGNLKMSFKNSLQIISSMQYEESTLKWEGLWKIDVLTGLKAIFTFKISGDLTDHVPVILILFE